MITTVENQCHGPVVSKAFRLLIKMKIKKICTLHARTKYLFHKTYNFGYVQDVEEIFKFDLFMHAPFN